MMSISKSFFISVGIVLLVSWPARAGQQEFLEYCYNTYIKTKECPTLCQLQCADETTGKECQTYWCLPRKCTELSAAECPPTYCSLMTNCSQEKICHYQMEGEKPECGDEAYAGQDVSCCPGLVRRCGYEFADGTCDMEGKNDPVYSLPICVSCGDGLCGQFESYCNCPEDCPTPGRG